MTARYLLCPDYVRSRADGQWHHVGACQLAALYGVPMSECIVAPDEHGALGGGRARVELMRRADRGELIVLRPRADGDYRLPAPKGVA